jgi:KDO2-lipid IV(A) lauroyltransferase
VDDAGSGTLVLTCHLGNWEAATVGAMLQEPDYRRRFHVIRRPLPLPWLERWVHRWSVRAGLGVIPKRGALRQVEKLLHEGKKVVFVFDQHASPRDGVTVDFLGRPAGTSRILALLALRSGAPVVPMVTWREADGTHVVRFDDPVPAVRAEDPDESVRATTQAFNTALERFILRHPEQWFWVHRRWKASLPPPRWPWPFRWERSRCRWP